MSTKSIRLPGAAVPEYFTVDTKAGRINPMSLTLSTETQPEHKQGWRLALSIAGPAGMVTVLLTKEDAQRLGMNLIAQSQED